MPGLQGASKRVDGTTCITAGKRDEIEERQVSTRKKRADNMKFSALVKLFDDIDGASARMRTADIFFT